MLKVTFLVQRSLTNRSLTRNGITFAFLFLVVLAGLINLDSSLWWDEGWTLSVARNWVERGHYGRLLAGQPASAGLEAAFPVVWPIVASFELLGVGVFQGRLPGILFTFGALALLYHLARQLFDSSAGWGALYAVLLLLSLPSVNPILSGRQALADMPLIFYLLAGHACFLAAWRRPILFMPFSILFWGIAVIAKAQTLPFWLVSLAVPFLLAFFQRNWRSCGLLLAGVIGSWYASRLLLVLQMQIIGGHTIPGTPIEGIYQAVALAPYWNVRARSLIVLGISGLPTLFGLAYFAWRYSRQRDELELENGEKVVKLALFVLAGSWLGWFVLLSNGGPRYLAAPGFLGGIFVGKMLEELTAGFDFRSTILRAANTLKFRQEDRSGLSAIFAIVIAVPMAIVTLAVFYPTILQGDDTAILTAEYLNENTEPDALVETYESELFFFLERPYHFPPDQVHVDLIRRYYFEQDFEIDYDPLAADPDYLVVGPTSAAWRVYELVLETGAFHLIEENERYRIYARARVLPKADH